jgi:hypothetical protein
MAVQNANTSAVTAVGIPHRQWLTPPPQPFVVGWATDAEGAADFSNSRVMFGDELNEGVFLFQREMIQ